MFYCDIDSCKFDLVVVQLCMNGSEGLMFATFIEVLLACFRDRTLPLFSLPEFS